MLSRIFAESDQQLNINFGYQCSVKQECSSKEFPASRSSFAFLSGAAISANATLANTNIGNGLLGMGILPNLDSPKTFHKVASLTSLSSLDVLSSSSKTNITSSIGSMSSHGDFLDSDVGMFKSMSAPISGGFLNVMEVQMAGGAAGEDRVQAVCSEENGWLFCAIFDGFNGRDAADFLAGTLYENIVLYLNLSDSRINDNDVKNLGSVYSNDFIQHFIEDDNFHKQTHLLANGFNDLGVVHDQEDESLSDSFRCGIVNCLQLALAQAESDFLHMVEREMDDRPDLVSIGSCVLVVFLHGSDLYTLSLGDSRAILATSEQKNIDTKDLEAIQLMECHSVDNEMERMRLLSEHPDDPKTIVHGKVKGKLKLTRAFGVGYLKERKMNDALMGILQVPNLCSPPYISTEPSVSVHRLSEGDRFVILASDGLFDFLSNEEVVKLVSSYILSSPTGDPAKFLVEQLLSKAAKMAGLSLDDLLSIPAGMRRKYHDDVTVMVILLGTDSRTSTASTYL
ncbi:unnamed protein product [Musa hybrid cultivar]